MDKSSVKSVRNLGCKDFVMFPRTQLKGIDFEEVEKEFFSAECKHIEGHGDFWIVRQKDYPRMLFQVFPAKNLAHFDMILGQLLGIPDNPKYLKDCYEYVVVFQGCHDYVPVTPTNYKDVANLIRSTHNKAVCWWYMYGKVCLLLNNV